MCGVQAAVQAAALKQQLNAVFDSMARDLQQTMLSSPQRAALLHNSGPHPKVSETQSRRLRPHYGLEQQPVQISFYCLIVKHCQSETSYIVEDCEV